MADATGRRSLASVHALSVTYRLAGATAGEHAELREQLAPALAAVPGLVSALWLANPDTGRFGALCLFDSKGDFDSFVASELYEPALHGRHVEDLVATDFAIDLVTIGERRSDAT